MEGGKYQCTCKHKDRKQLHKQTDYWLHVFMLTYEIYHVCFINSLTDISLICICAQHVCGLSAFSPYVLMCPHFTESLQKYQD